MTSRPNIIAITLLLASSGSGIPAQSPQNPSPMVEHVREHPRLAKVEPAGQRHKLTLGRLFVPEAVAARKSEEPIPLLIAFHCGDWIPEVASAGLESPMPCVTIGLGAGSERYSRPFRENPELISKIVEESQNHLGRPVSELILVGWSAGYGSIREIVRIEKITPAVRTIILLDGLHTGYVNGKPGPKESALEEAPLMPFLSYAKEAIEGRKSFIYLHSEIFPGTFASTTETADWLIGKLGLKREAVLRWGPMKTQMLGETRAGKLTIQAFAGNSAPDHVDLLHALPEVLREAVDGAVQR